MTVETKVICNGCGAEEKPPRNSGWVGLMILGQDGITFVDCLGHLCDSCKIDMRRWMQERKEKADAARKRAVS